jgi:hypothetical protein
MSVTRICDRCGKSIRIGEKFYMYLCNITLCIEGGTDKPKTEEDTVYSTLEENNEICTECLKKVLKAQSTYIKLGPDKKKRKKAGRPKGSKKRTNKQKVDKKASEKTGRAKTKVKEEKDKNKDGSKPTPPPKPSVPK